MSDKTINRIFTIVITVLLVLLFLQLMFHGYPFVGLSCLLIATGIVFVVRAEEKRVK